MTSSRQGGGNVHLALEGREKVAWRKILDGISFGPSLCS